MRGLHTIEAMGNQLTGSIPNEMMGMNPNLRLNFTDNLYVDVVVRPCDSIILT